MQREEKIWLMCLKKNNTDATLGVVGESRNDDIHHHTRPQHSINGARHGPSPSRQRAPLPRDEQRRLLPDSRVQFYVSPYARTRSTLHELRRCFLKKRIISVREESRVRERNFENFHVKERMKDFRS
ncbi:Phosphoglycerate mutase-like protein AT74 [Glycine soja]